MTPTTERVNEILATRSTDSRRGDMEALSAYIASLHAELATARAELDRIHGVVLEMHNAARGEIYTKGAAAGAWAETVNRLGFSADAKRGAHDHEN